MNTAVAKLIMVLAAVLVACGCGRDGLVAVSGQVTLDGEPIAKGTIQFLPVDGLGPGAESIIADGAYQVSVTRGRKNVLIRGLHQTGLEFLSGPEGPGIPVYEDSTPPRYVEPGTITCTIEPATPLYDFELSRAP